MNALEAIQLRMWSNLCSIDMPPCTSEFSLFGGASGREVTAVILLAPNFIAVIVVPLDGPFVGSIAFSFFVGKGLIVLKWGMDRTLGLEHCGKVRTSWIKTSKPSSIAIRSRLYFCALQR